MKVTVKTMDSRSQEFELSDDVSCLKHMPMSKFSSFFSLSFQITVRGLRQQILEEMVRAVHVNRESL